MRSETPRSATEMAYVCPKDLDGFMDYMSKADTKVRQRVGADLLLFLADPFNPITCRDIGQLIDDFVPWMQSSNYKVSSNCIEVMTSLVDRLGHDFRPYLQTVLPCVIDRLGDARDTVREKAQLLILKLLERDVLTPQNLFDKLTPCFAHKNAKIREEVLRCLVNTLNEHGARSVVLSKLLPHIVKLLSDPTASVRDTAFNTVIDMYKHVGERLRTDLQKTVPAARLPALLAKFDECRDAGELLPTAAIAIDFISVDEMPKLTVPPKKPGLGTVKRTNTNSRGGSPSPNPAGAVDKEIFQKLFDQVPTVQLFSPREVNDHMKSIQEIISDPNKDWNKRTDALKKLRSLLVAGAANYEDFHTALRNMEYALQASIKDLRSQVVREACITIAFLSQTLGSRFGHAAECLLNTLINLIQNSAKIVATSGVTCLRFIIEYTQNPRLISVITTNQQSSKSKDIRRSCCEVLDYILSNWPTHLLEKHLHVLAESLKRGIADADADARVISRKAFRGFRDHFPEQADALLQSLESNYRKLLQGELCLSSSSSSGSLAQVGAAQRAPYVRMPLQIDSKKKNFRRSNSAMELQAAQRAKARAQYSAMDRQKISPGTGSLQSSVTQQARPRKMVEPSTPMTPERLGRTRTRSSHSQPTSRSGSPSSRYLYGRNHAIDNDSPRPRRVPSRIPRSTQGSRDASRETSPSRNSLSRFHRNEDRPPISPGTRTVMAQKILQQSREAENAFANAFVDQPDGDYHRISSPRKLRSMENHSDDSETSSVCSERSLDMYRRASDSYSWSGSQQRLSSRDLWEPCHDIIQIIALCASTVWQERKHGLVSLRNYLNNDNPLSPGELRHITEIFTKMFTDSHTKSLTVLLDTINELIRKHKHDLHEWLKVLLQRMFLKHGTDLLFSVQGKLSATLDNIRKNFPVELQLMCVYKFLVDVFQTPNTGVKLAVLHFLASLYAITDPDKFVTEQPAGQALQKIISYTQDPKSLEIRNAAKLCIAAMWNANTPMVTMMLSELPKEQQEIASSIVAAHMKKTATDGGISGSPHTTPSPKTLSPDSNARDNGDMNQEEYFKSLKKTTAEIQKYSYETGGANLDNSNDTTSEVIAGIFGYGQYYKQCKYDSINNQPKKDLDVLSECSVKEILKNILENCVIDNPLPDKEKWKLLEQLILIARRGNVEPIKVEFKRLLRIFIDTLNQKNPRSSVIIMQILAEFFKNEELEECWSTFTELMIMKVFEAYCSEYKEVIRAVEETIAAMRSFPFHTVTTVLMPLIQITTYPNIEATMKMLQRFVEMHPDEVTDEHLAEIMPSLVKANDHDLSSARKCAVFCMVAIHQAVGEKRFMPHIKALTTSKERLLLLYIDKNQKKNAATAAASS